MSIIRFGVSLDRDLLEGFDRLIKANDYANRSEAIRDLIRDRLVGEEWNAARGLVTGVISLVYDHHKRDLVDDLVTIQHNHQEIIISSQHIHLDHDNCLEVVIVKGEGKEVKGLAAKLRSAKGVKHGELIMTTTGAGIQ